MNVNILEKEMKHYITFYIKYYFYKAQIGCKVEENYACISFTAYFFLSDIEGKLEFCQEGS